MENRVRKIYIDVIRIIGALMVLYIHGGSFHQWEHESMSLFKRIIYMLPAIISSSAVPLFMMVSGSLLLKKDESIKEILNKRVAKVALLILLITVLHYIYDAFHGSVDFSKFVYNLINLNEVSIVYWFMYWWLSFALMLFCYQQISKVLDKEHIVYIMIFCLFFNTILPILNLIFDKIGVETLTFSGNLSIPLFVSSSFFYPFLGYYLDNRHENSSQLNNSVLVAFILIFCITTTMFLNLYFKVDDTNVPARNVFTQIITVCIYLLIKIIFANVNIKPNMKLYKIISFFGSNAIGVYAFQVLFGILFHSAICNLIYRIINIKKIVSMLYMIITFICLSVITSVLKKVPIFKKALG